MSNTNFVLNPDLVRPLHSTYLTLVDKIVEISVKDPVKKNLVLRHAKIDEVKFKQYFEEAFNNEKYEKDSMSKFNVMINRINSNTIDMMAKDIAQIALIRDDREREDSIRDLVGWFGVSFGEKFREFNNSIKQGIANFEMNRKDIEKINIPVMHDYFSMTDRKKRIWLAKRGMALEEKFKESTGGQSIDYKARQGDVRVGNVNIELKNTVRAMMEIPEFRLTENKHDFMLVYRVQDYDLVPTVKFTLSKIYNRQIERFLSKRDMGNVIFPA